MKVTAKWQNEKLVHQYVKMVEGLGSPKTRKELHRGVIDAGRKAKTKVQRAVTQQMALKPGNYSFVVRETRGVPLEAKLAFDIFSLKDGLKIDRYKGLAKSGTSLDQGMVRSGIWNNPRTFKRSFEVDGAFYAMRPPEPGVKAPRILWSPGLQPGQPRDGQGRFASTGTKIEYGRVRGLFGPALGKEIPTGDSLATFQSDAPRLLDQAVEKRLAKLIRF